MLQKAVLRKLQCGGAGGLLSTEVFKVYWIFNKWKKKSISGSCVRKHKQTPSWKKDPWWHLVWRSSLCLCPLERCQHIREEHNFQEGLFNTSYRIDFPLKFQNVPLTLGIHTYLLSLFILAKMRMKNHLFNSCHLEQPFFVSLPHQLRHFSTQQKMYLFPVLFIIVFFFS